MAKDIRPTTNDRLLVLTGPVHCGKTTFLGVAVASWKASGLRVGGFLSMARLKAAGIAGYDLVDLRDGGKVPFLTRTGETGGPVIGPFRFFPAGLEKAARILARDRAADVLVVDEVGPLEMTGNGLWPALAKALRAGARCLCIVRDTVLDDFCAKVAPAEPRVFRIGDQDVLESLTRALSIVRGGGPRRIGKGNGA